MFNANLRKEAIKELENSFIKYDKRVKNVMKDSEKLFNIRQKSGKEIIRPVENYINILANSPKEFDTTFSAYKAEFQIFKETLVKFEKETLKLNVKSSVSAGSGVAVGVGVASLMPSAAMAIATTFGVASTGTAIASLSGVVATNAALAWIGGGALAAGGGGMATGSALLALAGPIGISIGVISLIGSGLFASTKNKEIAQKANQERAKVETHSLTLKVALIEIKNLIDITVSHKNGIKDILEQLKKDAPKNYGNFDSSQKNLLASMINHIHSLSKLLNKKVQ